MRLTMRRMKWNVARRMSSIGVHRAARERPHGEQRCHQYGSRQPEKL
jgi:hypothetical protein